MIGSMTQQERENPDLLAGHNPAPSLLHGDLWGGNWGVLPDDEPVVFDPTRWCSVNWRFGRT